MGGVPFHMPMEALLRTPPPQYTSQSDLRVLWSQVNRAFVEDEENRPPPLYSSKNDLSTPDGAIAANGREPPPLYRSRLSLNTNSLNRQYPNQPQQLRHHQADDLDTSRDSDVIEAVSGSDQRRRIHNGRVARSRNVGRVCMREIPMLTNLTQLARRGLSHTRRSRNRRRRTSRGTSTTAQSDGEQFFGAKPRAIIEQYRLAALNQRSCSTTDSSGAESEPIPRSRVQTPRIPRQPERREQDNRTLSTSVSSLDSDSKSRVVRYHPLDARSPLHHAHITQPHWHPTTDHLNLGLKSQISPPLNETQTTVTMVTKSKSEPELNRDLIYNATQLSQLGSNTTDISSSRRQRDKVSNDTMGNNYAISHFPQPAQMTHNPANTAPKSRSLGQLLENTFAVWVVGKQNSSTDTLDSLP